MRGDNPHTVAHTHTFHFVVLNEMKIHSQKKTGGLVALIIVSYSNMPAEFALLKIPTFVPSPSCFWGFFFVNSSTSNLENAAEEVAC